MSKKKDRQPKPTGAYVKSDGVSSKNDTSKTSSIKTYIHPRFSNPNKNFKVKNIRQKIFGRVKNK